MKKNIIYGVLDWGLGHASRSIPVIDMLLQKNVSVSIASSGLALKVLSENFPDLPVFELPSYNISVSSGNSMVLKIAGQLPYILKITQKEHRIIEKLVNTFHFNGVISDNRYGLWSSRVPSVFITHQLNIQVPDSVRITGSLVNKINRHYIGKFNTCWIPDYSDENKLSGKLSECSKTISPVEFLGPLSRFSEREHCNGKTYRAVAVISGPEPQRTILEEILIKEMNEIDADFCLVRGLPGYIQEHFKINRISVYNYLNTIELQDVFLKSELIISRSGYSSIMDLAVSGKKALLIPTPGQSEQEYLARFHYDKNHYLSVCQKDIDLKDQLIKAGQYPGIKINSVSNLLENAVESFVCKL